MLDTLLLRPSLHFATRHYTCRHFTSAKDVYSVSASFDSPCRDIFCMVATVLAVNRWRGQLLIIQQQLPSTFAPVYHSPFTLPFHNATVNDTSNARTNVNIEARSRNQCYRGKSVKHSGCVCSLRCPACNAHVPCYTVICGLSGSTRFFHIIS
jgi:hypothetical protein